MIVRILAVSSRNFLSHTGRKKREFVFIGIIDKPLCNLMAIPQTNVKRMLAYSGVAHIGYMLLGLAALTSNGVDLLLGAL